MRTKTLGFFAAFVTISGFALAQEAPQPPADTPSAPPAAQSTPAPEPDTKAGPPAGDDDAARAAFRAQMKVAAKAVHSVCRHEATRKGLSAQKLRNFTRNCIKEARMSCQQEAQQQESDSERRDTMLACMREASHRRA